MKVSKVEWTRCPHCNFLMNGYGFYPAQVIMTGESYLGFQHKCKHCRQPVIVYCEVKVKFEMEKDEG